VKCRLGALNRTCSGMPAKFFLTRTPVLRANIPRARLPLGHTTTNYYTGSSPPPRCDSSQAILGLRDDKDTAPSSSAANASRRQRKRVR
jgi:hypothetical protein